METKAGALRAGLLALVGTTAATAVLLLSSATPGPEPLAWLSEELGAPSASAPLKRQVSGDTWVALDGRGFRVDKGASRLSLSTRGIVGAGPWQRHAGGVTRTTSFGRETITVNPRKTELYLRVDERLGKRTWRWNLDTTLTPTLTKRGAVVLRGSGDSITINPFAVYDSAGRDVTPAGARFGLERGSQGWVLTATIDDAGLSLPYAVDPGISNSAPSPYREAVIGESTELDYYRLGESSGTSAANQVSGAASGTWEGSPTFGAAGLLNDSDTTVVFDGVDDRVSLGSLAPPATIEAWIKTTATGQVPIWSNRPGAGTLYFGLTGGRLFVFTSVPGGFVWTDPFLVNDGKVHHVAYTYDGTTGRLFIDGVERGSGAYTLAGAASPAFIGFDPQNNEYFSGTIDPGPIVPGTIDEVSTYSSALTASQLAAHYDRGRDFGLTIGESLPNMYESGIATDGTGKSTGKRVFYNPATTTGGSFTVSSNAADAEDAVSKVNFGAIAGTTRDTDPSGGDDTAAPYQTTYTWGASRPAGPLSPTVTISNNSAAPVETSAGTFTLTPDTTPPTGGSISYPAGYASGGTVTISTTNATADDLSGVAPATIQRQTVALSGNVCGTFPDNFVTGVITVTSPDTVPTGQCARYRLRTADNVDNAAFVDPASPTLVKVDTTAPSAPALTVNETDVDSHAIGGTLYARTLTGPGEAVTNGGSFSATATTADAQSDILNVSFPDLGLGGAATPTSSPYNSGAYTWTTSTAGTTGPVTATNNAGGTATTPLNFTLDNSNPTGGTISVPAFSGSLGGIAITAGAFSDADSTIDTNVITRSAGLAPSSPGVCPGSGYTGATVVTSPDTVPTDGRCYVYTLTGTDKVGNVATVASSPILVDTTPPSPPALAVSESDADSHAIGGTLYARTAADGSEAAPDGGAFTASATTADGQSGIASVAFPGLGLGGAATPTSSPYNSGTYTWTTATAGTTGPVTATNNAGGTATTPLNFTLDNANPTGGTISVPAFSGSLGGIAITAGAFSDADSTIDTNVITRSAGLAPSSPGVCPGSGYSGATVVTSPDTVPDDGRCYVYTLTGTDKVGNLATVASSPILVDTTPPSVALATVTEVLGADNQFFNSGSATHFYRPAGGGEFTIDATSSDAESGTNSVTFPNASGWVANGGGSPSSPVSGSTYRSNAFTWSAAQSADPAEPLTITAVNRAAVPATTGITIDADSAAPTGTTITCNGGSCAGTFGSSRSVTLAGSTDGSGSGIREIRYTTDGSTPTAASGLIYGAPFTVATTTTVRFRAIDNVSNEETVGSQTITIDTIQPTLSSATTGGTSTLTLVFSETLASSATPGSAFVLSRTGSTSIAGTGTATVSGTGVTVTLASAPPAGQSGWTLAYSKPGGAANLRDGVGNEVDPISGFSVATGSDTTPPETTIDSGPSASVSSAGATFAFSSSEPGSTFECKLDAGAFAACTSPKSYTGLAAGSHTFEVRATDPASNQDATPATRTWTVDTTAPTTSVGSGPAEGSSTTSTSASFGFTADESGTTFECKLDGGAFAACTSPKSYTGLAVGSHTFQVRATDAAGNVGAAATRTWTVTGGPAPDTTPPTTTIDSGPSGSTTATGATFTFSANESATFECRLDGGAFAGCTSPKSYTALAVGSHTFDVRGTDASANTGAAASRTWTITAPVSGDSPPDLDSSFPADGDTVASVSSITLTATEPVIWSAVTVTHENGTVTPLLGTATPTTSITRAFGPSTQGLHTVRATLSDGVNPSVAVTSHFTRWIGQPGADAPPSEINAGGNKAADVTASNQVASVEVPAGATSDAIVLRIDPSPTTASGSGFSIGSDTLEVTARRVSDGSPVTTFAQPLDIEFPNAPADGIPQRSQTGGAYSPIMLTFSHSLPSTWDDGYFRDSSGTIHILTRHLTYFAIFRDTQSPTAPRSLVGVVAGDGLTLRWEPATDNSEITGYVLLVDGAVAQVFGAQTFEAKLGLFTAGDTRTFSIQARDAAGRLGPTTGGVRGVPSLIGLTLEQATAALAARGFSLGSVSSGPGAAATATISGQTPSAPGTGSVGSSVNVVVGAVPGQARLVLRVASPKRISLVARKWIGVRVTVSARSTVVGELVSSRGRVVQRYAARSVPSGASTLRFALPTGKITATDRYRLHLRATASGQSAARTARVQIVPGVLKARFTPAKKPIGVVVIDGSIKGLNLGSSFRITHVEPSLAFDVIGLHPAFVEAAVVDMSVVSKGFIRSLRQVFPELQILALAPTSKAAGQARAEGASIALVKPVPTSRIAAMLRRTLGR